MKIINISLGNVPQINEEITLCLGYFDGVHLGHQKIIETAKKFNNKIAVLTFENSPSFVLGKKDFYELNSLADKIDIFENKGIDFLYIMPFDKSSINITKHEFVNDVIKLINPKKICCGIDYTFGTRGEGNPDFLRNYFDVETIDLLFDGDTKISSTLIRSLIVEGHIEMANKYLGYPYKMVGLVVKGNQIGRTLDFPTANIDPEFDYVMPKNGVYFGKILVNNFEYDCLISIGTHPTIYESDKPIIETYIYDFDEVIYGRTIEVSFLNYIREIQKFETTEELKVQIQKDIEYRKNKLK